MPSRGKPKPSVDRRALTTTAGNDPMQARWRLVAAQPGEGRALLLSFALFFLLLLGYYMLRPLRDALAARLGPDEIKYLSTATFVTMLITVPIFGWLATHVRRQYVLVVIYGGAALALIGVAPLLAASPDQAWLNRAFYVWLTVFNLPAVAVFWSFMADIWQEQQARRLFGTIAAAGSLGGIQGPLLTGWVVQRGGLAAVITLAALAFLGCVACVLLLAHAVRGDRGRDRSLDKPMGGNSLSGILLLVRSPFLLGIAAITLLSSIVGMFTYIEVARLARATFTSAEGLTLFFSRMDLLVNGSALLVQWLLSGLLMARFGVPAVLAGAAALGAAAFLWIPAVPGLLALAATSAVRRVIEFGLFKPARDTLYTVVDEQTKYKAKNVTDTAIARSGDASGGWLHSLASGAGAGLTGIAWIMAALAAVVSLIAVAVGKGYRARSRAAVVVS